MDEVGFIDFLDGLGLFANGCGDGVYTDGAAAVFVEDREHDLAVDFVQAEPVYFEEVESSGRDGQGDFAIGADLGVVAHAAQKTVRDAWCTAASAGDFGGAFLVHGDVEEMGGALNDGGEFGHIVVIQMQDQAEAAS